MKSEAVNSDQVTAGVTEVKDDITAGIAEYLGVGSSMANRREYLIFLAASLLVSLGIVSLLGYIYLWPRLQPYYAIISDPEKISGIFRAAGDWAPIVYILLEIGQVLTMFWPVPLEIAGGFLFGLPLGIVYSMIGLTLGAVVAHVILGLPGEGPREMAATAEFLARLPVDGVKIHLLYVVKDSGLARLHEQGEYVCLTEDQYVSGVVDFIERLPPHLVIHRLTSDPHAEELVAPAWSLDKPRVMKRIREEFLRRGTRQGSHLIR